MIGIQFERQGSGMSLSNSLDFREDFVTPGQRAIRKARENFRLEIAKKAKADNGICLRREPNGVKGYDWKPQRKKRIEPPKIATKIPIPDEACRNCKPTPVDLSERVISVAEIQTAVCAITGLRMNELKCERRMPPLVERRQLAMMLCKLLTEKSLPFIGRRFGGRDHTTVLHATRKYYPVEILIRDRVPTNAPILEWVMAAIAAAKEVFPDVWDKF